MSEQYYVFSDETGHWCESLFYIRSWVVLSEEEYFKLEDKIKLFKKKYDKENELKFSIGHDYSIFCDLNFEVYFTVTFCDDFRRRNFDLMSNIDGLGENSFIINGKNIKDKLMNTIKNSIFFNIYEYYHLENTLKFLREKFSGKKLFFMIDNPQCQNKTWKEMFIELNENLDTELRIINDSRKEIGVQFADVLAGNLGKILRNLNGTIELNEFDKKIISKFSQGNGQSEPFLNNPQIVMWKSEHQEFVNKIEGLIQAEE